MLLCVMPTASTASLLNNSEAAEFLASNMFSRKILAGEFLVVNHYMVADMKRIGLWNKKNYDSIVENKGSLLQISEEGLSQEQKIQLRWIKEKYLTMFEIKPSIMIGLAAQRQVVIDHSQSFNLYIEKPSEELLAAIHDYTGEMGMKTGMYYLRTKATTEQLAVKETHEVCTREEGCISCQ
jgi:ribonucleotide reductase alpha subunit